MDIAFSDCGFEIIAMIEENSKHARSLAENIEIGIKWSDPRLQSIYIRGFHPPDDLEIDFIIGEPPFQTLSVAWHRAAGVAEIEGTRRSLFEVPRVEIEKLTKKQRGEPSVQVSERVKTTRQRRWDRFAGTKLSANADMGNSEVIEYLVVADVGSKFMRSAMAQLSLSARAFHRVLKEARTIADLGGNEQNVPAHLAETLQ